MHSYDIDALYSAIVQDFWTERGRANATGGNNNIRAKGDGPEKAVRDWIATVVGARYRVTEGHVVRADGRKSKQMDVIIVRDEATATMYGSRKGESELVRAECVAAVGEVKASWYDHAGVLQSYVQMARELESLQEGLRVENRARFGSITGATSIRDVALPITGRAWLNPCYTFIIALGLGKCDPRVLAGDLAREGVAPRYATALILDEAVGGIMCIPCRESTGKTVIGVQCEVARKAEEIEVANHWETFQETIEEPRVAAGRLLHLFLADLQRHLSTWSWEPRDPRPYVKLSPELRRLRGTVVSKGSERTE